MEISEHFKKYLSGFFDDDGSVTLEKLKDTGFTLRIKFSQSNNDWIDTINRYYPFLHKSTKDNRTDNHRIEYQLRSSGLQIEPLIDDLLKYSILKYEQLLEAKNYIKLINVRNKYEDKKIVYDKLVELKKCSKNKPYDRLNVQYIAGLFDSEGSIGIYNNSLRVKITQKSDIVILEKIRDFYDNQNTIDNYAISFYGVKSLKLLNDILPFCIYKVTQIESAIEYIKTLSNTKLIDDKIILDIREKCINVILDEKHVDINVNNIQFKNQENNKIFLRDCFTKFRELSYDDVLLYCKMLEINEMKDNIVFNNSIYNTKDWENININPILEFCETDNQLKMYAYYRKKVSSLPSTGIIGRVIRILVKDSISNKYIGIMCLSSDVYSLGERDCYIKQTSNVDWNDKDIKDKYLKRLVNISCCVPLQPFGFNTAGGKLIASLAFSREIFDYYLLKYKEPLLAIITTSINGKSIQYSRLKCLKMIGFTKGFGSVNIPNELYSVCHDYNNNWKVIKKSDRVDRFSFLKLLLTHLDLNKDILKHNHKRGIYFGYVFTSKFSNEYNINELDTVSNILNLWKNRWCNKRITNLLKDNRIKNDYNLYTSEYFSNLQFNRFKLPIIKEKVLTDSLIKDILTYKSKNNSQDNVAQILSKKYNINLLKGDISFVYLGKILPLIKDEEYNTLFNVKNFKKRNLSDIQIYFILDYHESNLDNSYTKIAEVFNIKYNQEVSKATVSDIVLKKLTPIDIRDIKKLSKEINPLDKINLLTTEQLLVVINFKSQSKTTQDVTDYIKENYQIYIKRDIISKLWKGEIPLSNEIQSTVEYTNMTNNIKLRTVRATKFTKEELEFLKTTTGSLLERSIVFTRKFGKTITKAYISKLDKNKL